MEKLVVYQARSYDAERIVELMRLLVEQEGEACTLTAKYVEKKYLLTKGSHILLAGRGWALTRWACSRFPSARTCSTARPAA